MITYLIKFVACSGLLLLAYQLLLKNKAIYRFNRMFLLAALACSLIIPLISIGQQNNLIPQIIPTETQTILANEPVILDASPTITTTPTQAPANYTYIIVMSLYGIGVVLLLTRFIGNLYKIVRTVSQNPKVAYQNATLVLIPQGLTPHSFFKYIFINANDYHQNQIEDKILQHELSHARQMHSVDIVLIELLQVFCWFNPFIIGYRKAIQLNHEFLADEAVLSEHPDVVGYQHLLVSSLTMQQSLAITSQFNYSLTKKRLIMMTKKTSALTAAFSTMATFVVLGTALFLFCNATTVVEAARRVQRTSILKDIRVYRDGDTLQPVKWPKVLPGKFPMYPHSKEGIPQKQVEEYAAMVNSYYSNWTQMPHKSIKLTPEDKAKLMEIYQHMSIAQQKQQRIGFVHTPPPHPLTKPTEADYNSFKNARMYGVWLNDKHIPNADLDKYKTTEIAQLFVSKLTDKAIDHNKYKYQVDLMTIDYFEAYRKKEIATQNESHPIFRMGPNVKY